MPKVYWGVLMERALLANAVDAMLDLAGRAALLGYQRIAVPFMPTDKARNNFVKIFREESQDPNDVLVMLDADHEHPTNIIERLVSHQVGVVGALAFMRTYPHHPCVFLREPSGALALPVEWQDECEPVTTVGTGAIAIRRYVFDELASKGCKPPFFRYTYPEDQTEPSEDTHFGELCEQAGIPHYCDYGLVTPHLAIQRIKGDEWRAYVAAERSKQHAQANTQDEPETDQFL